ncbi:MAG: hypothetical protein CVU89_09835 [Firmicutes bacterium HGW-Firmicutes-14]|nr:MAG: hypothetical protein CVU89_09835 [Firmicutes bacterium HGW-Firmicutes-14]
MGKLLLYFRKPFLLQVILLCIPMILLASGPAFADSAGPALSGISPADGAVINVSKITISVTAKDPDKVNAQSVVMKVNGNTVSTIKQYGWKDEYTDDLTLLSIYYSASLGEGTHNVYISVKDSLGNLTEHAWSFTISAPPQISSLTPADGATVSGKKPVISAVVTDNTAIDETSINMTLDGNTVPASYDPVTGTVSFVPQNDLANETTHSVVLNIQDTAGNPARAEWSFRVVTYDEMPFSADDNTCQACHLRSTHPMNNCAKCHGINVSADNPTYPLDDCYNCHFGTSAYPSAYHANGLPYLATPDHPVQATDSCVTCHTKNWSTGIPYYHTVTNTAERHLTTSEGCENCHSASLTREHYQRTDDSGSSLDCFTCHTNTEPRIQEAIIARDSSCSACHNLGADGGHPAHNNGLDSYCQTCHSDSILTESQFHQDNGCQVCHSKTAPEIAKYSINIKDTSCFSCHNQGHNVNFVQRVPEDIPLYPGFKWTVPQDAGIFAGEPWVDPGYDITGAKIVISNRLQSVDGSQVYSWYEGEMAANGWAKSADMAGENDNFTITFTKGIRTMTVNLYTGETHDPGSPFVGYKLEILYR